jgi:hypothetical protein
MYGNVLQGYIPGQISDFRDGRQRSSAKGYQVSERSKETNAKRPGQSPTRSHRAKQLSHD